MLTKNILINKYILFILAAIIIMPPFNSWAKIVLLSISFVVIFFSKKRPLKSNKITFFILIIILFVPKLYLNNYNIVVNHIVLPTSPSEKFDYVENNFEDGLSRILRKELYLLEKDEVLLKNIKQPEAQERSTLFKKFAFQSENIWNNLNEGKRILIKKNISFWDLGPSALNDTNLNFGDVKKKNYQTNLIFPVLFKVNLSKKNKNSNLCFIGNAIYKNINEYIILKNKDKNCIKISNVLEFYFLDYDRNLEIEINKSFFFDNIYIFIYLLILLQLSLLFFYYYKYNYFNIVTVFSFYLILFLYFKFGLQPISDFSETIYFDRGMDGMAHYGYARVILNNFLLGNYFESFKGVEEIFYYMPLTRYLNSFLMIFFGETILGSIFLISLWSIVLFATLRLFLDKKISKVLTIIFLFIPIFESLGFTIINYISFTVDGYGEGICYFAILLIFYLYFKNDSKFINFFIIGFLSFIVVGIRPNYIIFILFFFIFYALYLLRIHNYSSRSFKMILFLLIGSSPILLIPFHNYIYSNELILLVKADNVQNSYHVKIYDYFDLFISIAYDEINYDLLRKIINHFSHYIKIYEIWYFLTLLNLIISMFLKVQPKIKIMSFSLIMMHSTFLFFLGDPRYSMGAWLLSFIIFIIIFKEIYLPYFKSKIFSAKQ
tara:strand:+ start:881 stop:2866 length:1986 start_codon:yes stop_codon:yes gene_type:complete